MRITDVLLLVVEREGKDGLHGRTLLQKKLYFLSVLQKANFGFSAHYYGPYSGFVAEHLNGLVEDGIFKENTEFFTTDSTERNDLGEKRRHTYSLTDEGKKIWKIIQEKNDFPEWDKALKKINGQEIAGDFNLLSIAAKVHYIVDWEGEKSMKEVCQTAKEYGWDFTEKDIEKVLSFLRKLKLVKTKGV